MNNGAGDMVTLSNKRNIYLGSNGGWFWPGGGPTGGGFTINGQITGPGGLGVTWARNVAILNGSNSYQGPTTIGGYGNAYGDSGVGNPTLQLGNNNALPGHRSRSSAAARTTTPPLWT